jgi:hypothetical protein
LLLLLLSSTLYALCLAQATARKQSSALRVDYVMLPALNEMPLLSRLPECWVTATCSLATKAVAGIRPVIRVTTDIAVAGYCAV